MTTTQQIITIAVVVLGTMTTRFLPFIIFSADSAPEFVRFLGRVLPNAVIGLLVIYSLKDSIGGVNHCIPELIALAFIFILHKWKKNTLLSIAGGTILYMFLVQIVFQSRRSGRRYREVRVGLLKKCEKEPLKDLLILFRCAKRFILPSSTETSEKAVRSFYGQNFSAQSHKIQ